MIPGIVASQGFGAAGVPVEPGVQIHTFLSSGTFEITSGTGDVEYFVVGGGGGGGARRPGGGGGAGEVQQGIIPLGPGTYSVTIGAGGAGGDGTIEGLAAQGSDGGNTAFHSITAIGGGGGGAGVSGSSAHLGRPGGSGGGGGGSQSTGFHAGGNAIGTGAGNAGGQGYGDLNYAVERAGGGGGGAGGAGEDAQIVTGDNIPGHGGPGIVYGGNTYAEGGWGLSQNSQTLRTPQAGPANTGTGGDGSSVTIAPSGGSGIVILKIDPSVLSATGGIIS